MGSHRRLVIPHRSSTNYHSSHLSARCRSPTLAVLLLLVASSACLLCPLRSANAQAVADSQRPALAAIMDVWGAALNLNATWFVTPTCAQWQGLACNAMGQVTSLCVSPTPSYFRIKHTFHLALDVLRCPLQETTSVFLPYSRPATSLPVTLQTLDRNLLVGSVPPNIGYLSALTNLYAASPPIHTLNRSALFRLRRLFVPPARAFPFRVPTTAPQHCSSPRPSGHFPPPIAFFASMGGNALQGSIPAGISTLVSLRVLDLHENYLTGAIPDSFAPLTSLATLYAHLNRLRHFHRPLFAFRSSPSAIRLPLFAVRVPPSSFRLPLSAV
ncbi:unnamed protein product [Closterium sp. Naga37s-1]|nr:unnamed protein product [Closterium sp. Naga37s-1]